MPFEHSRASDDSDTALYQQLERHVLEHYPNRMRRGCLTSEVLKAVVCEPETLDLQDAKYQHIMECAECLREVIEFREARLAQTSLRPQDLSKDSQT